MKDLLIVALVGFLASVVDGSLGMGFGPTSSSLLLASGLSPITTSATVNLAKVATGVASAISHWRFGNIDRSLVLRLAVPGAVGAVFGALILTAADGELIRPLLAVLLTALGIRIILRFSRPLVVPEIVEDDDAASDGSVMVAGAAGGITNGLVGAWGPVVTPLLLQRGIAPRIAVGSTNTAEVAVAVVSAGSLLGSVGGKGFDLGVAIAMIAGGALAAPLGAYVIRFVPARVLGLAVGGLLMLTQIRELTRFTGSALPVAVIYGSVLAIIAVVRFRSTLSFRNRATAEKLYGESQDWSARKPTVGVVD